MTFLRSLLMVTLLLAPLSAHAQEVVAARTITVSGDAEVKVAPDKADVAIGIQEQNQKLKEAQRLTDEQLKALYRIAKEMGIAEKDLRTDYSSVQPIYEYTPEAKQIFKGYSVNHQVTVTLRDITKVAELTEKLLDAKIDQINNIQYGLQKEDEAREAALNEALLKAKRKAEMLAKTMNERIEKVYSINESGISMQPMPMVMRGKAMAMDGGGAVMPEMAAAPPAGEMAISANLTASFLLKE